MQMTGQQNGFTLIELIVVIVISGILSLGAMQFITRPVEAYADLSRRARLVDSAERALHHIARDVHLALPNSLRVGCGGQCLEMIRTVTGGRYRKKPPGDVLRFNPAVADNAFDYIGVLNHTTGLALGTNPSDCTDGTSACLVIYNTGLSGTDAWNADNVATLESVSAGQITFDTGGFSSGQTAFPAESPGQRFYITDTAISYLCDPLRGTLKRYQGYNLVSDQTLVDTEAELIALSNPAESALAAQQVSGCSFTYNAGTPSRNGVLTMSLTISEEGEDVALLQQLHVSNLP